MIKLIQPILDIHFKDEIEYKTLCFSPMISSEFGVTNSEIVVPVTPDVFHPLLLLNKLDVLVFFYIKS